MSVKTIFKTLIGTIVIIVLGCLITEIFNINITSVRLNNMMKLCANQSAELFSQETYKLNSDNSGSANLSNIYDADGNIYVSGQFYDGNTSSEIWHSLYEDIDFFNFITEHDGNWRSIDILNRALRGNIDVPVPDEGATAEEFQNYSDAMEARMYLNNLYTPLNIGIPYLDKDTVNHMFKWNLTQLLSDCNSQRICRDTTGKGYVKYNGFKCYTADAQITEIKYEVLDLNKQDDKDKFFNITSIRAERLGFEDDVNKNLQTMGIAEDERKRVCIAYISYKMPVAYEGVTPIKNVFEYIWKAEVDGLSDTDYNDGVEQTWNESTQDLIGGGTGNSTLPTSGRLVYYIVR